MRPDWRARQSPPGSCPGWQVNQRSPTSSLSICARAPAAGPPLWASKHSSNSWQVFTRRMHLSRRTLRKVRRRRT